MSYRAADELKERRLQIFTNLSLSPADAISAASGEKAANFAGFASCFRHTVERADSAVAYKHNHGPPRRSSSDAPQERVASRPWLAASVMECSRCHYPHYERKVTIDDNRELVTTFTAAPSCSSGAKTWAKSFEHAAILPESASNTTASSFSSFST